MERRKACVTISCFILVCFLLIILNQGCIYADHVSNQQLPVIANTSGNPPILGIPKIEGFNALGSDQDHINVSLTINVTADSGIASVILFYQNSSAASWKTSAMSLVGGVFIATVGYFKANDNISYYVNATDTLGRSVCSPANAPANYYSLLIPYHSVPPPGGTSNTSTPGFPVAVTLLGLGISIVGMVFITSRRFRSSLGKKNLEEKFFKD
ncbi:MAG TPA: hypothetical protein VKM55_30015 [Candidatus Lokiarchaeia archaeon]|nr:hypothetical protein [Candidatus Lokiarchaeia archaeon]